MQREFINGNIVERRENLDWDIVLDKAGFVFDAIRVGDGIASRAEGLFMSAHKSEQRNMVDVMCVNKLAKTYAGTKQAMTSIDLLWDYMVIG